MVTRSELMSTSEFVSTSYLHVSGFSTSGCLLYWWQTKTTVLYLLTTVLCFLYSTLDTAIVLLRNSGRAI